MHVFYPGIADAVCGMQITHARSALFAKKIWLESHFITLHAQVQQ
jgi:hypothetical protein